MTGRPRFDQRVLDALERVPRHSFVPAEEERHAYVNSPLPIGQGQTISQPYIVALMTDLLEPEPGDRMLEIGTGSGYQAAVLAELVDAVYSVEIVEPLGREAAARLERLGYDNVHVRLGDGWQGWPEHEPFDGIIVTAAAPSVPPPLLEQLAPGGHLVIPVRQNRSGEELTVITKETDGSLSTRGVLPVRFVPLTGRHGD
ncbi:MAG: protein-L-isoaspartate(D-aspartate) O-methyltransferase [Acidobacteriota bacterium]